MQWAVQYHQCFVLAMQVLLKAVEPSTEDAHLGKGVHMLPLKAFMDDTTILANRKAKAQSILDRFEQLMSWSRMMVKPSKSRSLSLRKGKLDNNAMFQIGGQTIPTLSEVPVKSLGRWYNSSLKDTEQSKQVRQMRDGKRRARSHL